MRQTTYSVGFRWYITSSGPTPSNGATTIRTKCRSIALNLLCSTSCSAVPCLAQFGLSVVDVKQLMTSPLISMARQQTKQALAGEGALKSHESTDAALDLIVRCLRQHALARVRALSLSHFEV